MHSMNAKPLSRQHGITLIESLVAIVVAALGILGILGVQMRTLTDTQTSVRRAQAIRLIEDLSERMKVNPNSLLGLTGYASGYDSKAKDYASANCSKTACAPEEQAAYDLKEWKTTVEQTLPLGQASTFLAPGETDEANRRQLGVIIAWRENERDISDADDKKTFKENIDASKFLQADGSFSAGTDDDNACPEGFTCHLQYLPVSARCAPYGNTLYCS
ncbi:type IV pilus modification protein PilV [Comamonas jiangduensis]|uniref:type IV pilus modification protein PilV n=1 Tax=Comamonas jiangduensis TaxID=1194168 RepID=UPI003BF84274